MSYKPLSANEVKNSYCDPKQAERYASYFKNKPRLIAKDRREKACIRKALAGLPAGSKVLDLPCGAGRFYAFLADMGFIVTSADGSPYMVDKARQETAEYRAAHPGCGDEFLVCDILKTPFADKQFDAVVCNRLFHHFADPSTRRAALAELKRICKGPIVVSFFSTVALDAVKFYFDKFIRRKVFTDRIPIAPWTFAADIRAAGLVARRWLMARPLISKQWYVVLESGD